MILNIQLLQAVSTASHDKSYNYNSGFLVFSQSQFYK